MKSALLTAVAAAALIAAACDSKASSTASWAALDKAARKACTADIVHQAGKAKVKSVSGTVLGIGGGGDRYYALLLKGTVAGFKQDWLCLYDKRAKTAQARDIQG